MAIFRLNPSLTTFVKLQDCGSMILEQQPMKVAEALLLFLKGEGHFTNLSILDISKKRAKAVAYQQDMLGNLGRLNFGYLIWLLDNEKAEPLSV